MLRIDVIKFFFGIFGLLNIFSYDSRKVVAMGIHNLKYINGFKHYENEQYQIQSQFHCPSKCICESIQSETTEYPQTIDFHTPLMSNKIDEFTPFTISIYCERGGLNNSDFFNILHEIQYPAIVESLTIQAPINRPNNFQWNDNLNRFSRLKRLMLINCGIPALSRSVKMPLLQHLNLKFNQINEIQIGTLIGLPALEVLDLSHNIILTIPTGAFIYSKKLKKLSLSHNPLNELSASMLRGPEQLIELEIDGNGTRKTFAQQLNNLFTDVGNSLERLEINGCGLDDNEIDNLQLTRVPKLKRLGLAKNNLKNVPSVALRALEQLQIIDLSFNSIKSLKPCAFCACNISRVLLSHNLLGSTDRKSKKKDNKNSIELNSIHSEAFAETQLFELDISYNAINNFDSRKLYDAQSSLKILHLSGNSITIFKETLIHTLPQLTHLHMSNNNIQAIPFSLPKQFTQLKLFNLSGNLLSDLPSNIAAILPSLQVLDLSNNKFSSLTSDLMLSFIKRLQEVFLYNNPWNCECAVQNLQQYMLQNLNYKNRLNYEKTLCDKPLLLRGQPLYRVQKINDCAILFGANYGLNQMSELLLLLAVLLITAFLVFVLIIFLLHCGKEYKQKIVYIIHEHSKMQLTCPLNVIEDAKTKGSALDMNESIKTSTKNKLTNLKNKQDNDCQSSIADSGIKNSTVMSQHVYKSPPSPGTLFVTF